MRRFLLALSAVVLGTLAAYAATTPALLFDMVKQSVANTPGTGAITLSAPVSGFQALTAAGGVNGMMVSYSIFDTPTSWEVGRGMFLTSTSSATLTRNPLWSSAGASTAINADSSAIVAVSNLAEDMLIGESTGTRAQRSGTTPQTQIIYNTSDVATVATSANYERLSIGWNANSNAATIATERGGLGSARDLVFQSINGGLYSLTSIWYWVPSATFSSSNASMQAGISAGNSILFFNNTGSVGWQSGSTSGGSPDVQITRGATDLLRIGAGGAGNERNGWLNWGGEARTTAALAYTSLNTLTNVKGLSVPLQANRSYSVDADIYFQDDPNGGLQLALAGTFTVGTVTYDGWIIDFPNNGIKGGVLATTLSTAVANATTTGASGHAKIAGTISTTGAGTLFVQAAQFTPSSTATTLAQGSRLMVQDIP